MVSYKVGIVNTYFPKLKMMAVDLTADLHLADEILINNQVLKVRKIKIDYNHVNRGPKGETVVINADFPVANGDELVRT